MRNFIWDRKLEGSEKEIDGILEYFLHNLIDISREKRDAVVV